MTLPLLARHITSIAMGFVMATLAREPASASGLFTSVVPPGFTWSKPNDGWRIGVSAGASYVFGHPMPVRFAIQNVSGHRINGDMIECLRLDAETGDHRTVSMRPPGLWGCDESMPEGDADSGQLVVVPWDLEDTFVWPQPGRYCVTVSGQGSRDGDMPGPARFCFDLLAEK